MGDLGQLLLFFVVVTVLSLLEAAGRKRRSGPMEGPEPEEEEEVRFPWEERDVAPGGRRVEHDLPPPPPTPEPGGAPEPGRWSVPGPVAPPLEREGTGEWAAPTEIAAVAEELREEGRRELRETAGPPEGPEGPPPREVPTVARGRRRESPAGPVRALLRGDPAALGKAVLYREILGPPVAWRPKGGGWEDPEGSGP